MDTIADLTPQTRPIRTETHPDCPLCGALGDVLYEGLKDRLFDVPGTWGFRRCPNADCRHVWLDPQPIAADLPLVYDRYYTHDDRKNTLLQVAKRSSATRTLRLPLRLAYSAFLRFSGISSARQKAYAMYLTGWPPGRLLDIGCGSGERLAYFARQGWQVVGQDVDPKAVDHARETYGLDVHLGPVESLPESFGAFDAVIMNHVIEHVSSPRELLLQAAARMAPEGMLVAVTPNAESLGHQWFKENWRGLEPPRHLHLFCPQSLKKMARCALLRDVRVATSAAQAEGLALSSFALSRGHRGPLPPTPTFKLVAMISCLQIVASLHHAATRSSGEECILLAKAGPQRT